MTSRLAHLKDTRRQRLAALLDKHGQTKLHELTGIAEAYLWQMAKGEGKSRRGVSDDNAARIEAALELPAGWLSGADPSAASAQGERAVTPPSQAARPDPFTLASAIKLARLSVALTSDEDSDDFDPEDPDDCEIVSSAFAWLRGRQQRDLQVDTVVEFAKFVRQGKG